MSVRNALILFLFITSSLWISCANDDPGTIKDCSGVVATYNLNVKIIFDTNCALSGCHNTSRPDNFNIDLSNYTSAKNVGLNGKMICAINHDNGCEPMPKSSPKLTAELIKTITCWVQDGAPQ
ncbi:MAG: hypothetical protein M3Q56_04400 [Bacteroidota bacterium]|nr:hypothetical protein [Bacteroidota bacterium]